jgi:hypothetical protein
MRTARTARTTNQAPIVVDEITLDGRQIQVKNVDLPITEVRLDPHNPRIANTVAFSMDDRDPALQKKLEDLLWSDDDVRDLYRQVLANKGLIERIIVRDDRTVVEGNCRTVVYRRLREKFPKEPAWRTIPGRLLPSDIGDRGIAILLGEMHVAGKNTWSPFEKAGHVYRMHREFSLTQDEIAQRLRMSKSRVNQLIKAFDVMKTKYLRKYPGPTSIRKFSYFEELYKKPALRDWVASTEKAEDLFVDWVGQSKISQGVHVRDLPAIVENEEAITALSTDGFEAAQRVLSDDNPALTSKLFRSMVEMTEALRKAQLDDIQRVRKPGRSKSRRIVLEMNEALDHFLELCGVERG